MTMQLSLFRDNILTKTYLSTTEPLMGKGFLNAFAILPSLEPVSSLVFNFCNNWSSLLQQSPINFLWIDVGSFCKLKEIILKALRLIHT